MSSPHPMTQMVANMQRVQSPARARQILALVQGRLSDIEHVGWPRLEASLKAELVELVRIARSRGMVR